jgi:hypothetical protein
LEATASSQRLDRTPRELDPLFAAEQVHQYEHPFMRTRTASKPI